MYAARTGTERAVTEHYKGLSGAAEEGELCPIFPHVGTAYEPQSGVLRLLGVGVNSYISPEDVGGCKPWWYRSWIDQRAHPFARGARKDLDLLGAALEGGDRYAGLSYDPDASVYVTNAVKRYLHERGVPVRLSA